MKAIRLYAQVMVDVIFAPNSGLSLDSIQKELSTFAEMFDESPMFLKVFDSPTLGDDEKEKALNEFVKRAKMSPFSERFLAILVKRDRLSLLPEILKEVQIMEIEKKGGLIGELTSAVPVDASVASGVADALSKRLQKPVQLKQKIDPSIIAGMRVTIGGVTYDGSVKSRLDKLVQNFH